MEPADEKVKVNTSTTNARFPLIAVATSNVTNGGAYQAIYDAGIVINPNKHSVAEGFYTTAASGEGSHAEGGWTSASGYCSHAENYWSDASGTASHAEGAYTDTIGSYSHAEGYKTSASGTASHAEGGYANAIGGYSHAEGY